MQLFRPSRPDFIETVAMVCGIIQAPIVPAF